MRKINFSHGKFVLVPKFANAIRMEINMTVALRILLFLFSMGSCYYVVRKIKKAQIRIEDSIFWILFFGLIVVLSIFPEIIFIPTKVLGVDSPVNLVYLIFIFILLIKIFLMSIKMSQMENKIKNLTQEIAINEKKKEKQ